MQKRKKPPRLSQRRRLLQNNLKNKRKEVVTKAEREVKNDHEVLFTPALRKIRYVSLTSLFNFSNNHSKH